MPMKLPVWEGFESTHLEGGTAGPTNRTYRRQRTTRVCLRPRIARERWRRAACRETTAHAARKIRPQADCDRFVFPCHLGCFHLRFALYVA